MSVPHSEFASHSPLVKSYFRPAFLDLHLIHFDEILQPSSVSQEFEQATPHLLLPLLVGIQSDSSLREYG